MSDLGGANFSVRLPRFPREDTHRVDARSAVVELQTFRVLGATDPWNAGRGAMSRPQMRILCFLRHEELKPLLQTCTRLRRAVSERAGALVETQSSSCFPMRLASLFVYF